MPDPSPADRAQAILDDLTAKEAETLRVVLTAAMSVSRSVIGALPPILRAKLLSEAVAAAGEQPVEQLAVDCLAAEAAVDRVRALHVKETDVIGFERPASAGPGEVAACRYCNAWWPCETIAALDADAAGSSPRRHPAEVTLDRVRALFAGGPDTPCRTTWHVVQVLDDILRVECVEVPLTDLRAALDGP